MRTEFGKLQNDQVRECAEHEASRLLAKKIQAERDELRVKNIELENRIAILDASNKLDSCRRSFDEV